MLELEKKKQLRLTEGNGGGEGGFGRPVKKGEQQCSIVLRNHLGDPQKVVSEAFDCVEEHPDTNDSPGYPLDKRC